MSDNILDADELLDDAAEEVADEIGMTSEEAAADDVAAVETPKKRKAKFSVFDAMLLLSLVFISLATLFMFWELRDFGDFPSEFPWRVSEFMSR